MSVSEREIEPSTLPQGIGRMTAAYTLFIAIDPMLFWQVIGHFCSHIDGVGLSSNVVLGVGAVIGIVTALNFIWFPLLLLDGRTPVAVAAFRKLCGLIGPLHILLVTIVLVNAAAVGFGEDGLITPVAFVAIPATPLLYFLVKPLFTMKWLDLTAPPESWGKLIGLDGSGRRSIAARGGQPSSMLVAVLLPPLACLRARFYWRAGIAGLLWLLGFALILAGSFDAVLPFVAAAALGRQVGLAGRVVPKDRADLSSSERLIRLRQIFTAERLKPPPFALATGLLAYLFMMPFIWVLAWYGFEISSSSSLHQLAELSVVPGMIIPFVTIALTIPSALIMPLGFRFGILWYRVTSTGLVATYCWLSGWFWRLALFSHGPALQGAHSLILLAAVGLTLIAPLAIGVAVSLLRVGELPRLERAAVVAGRR